MSAEKTISIEELTYEKAGITLKELLLLMNTTKEFPKDGWTEVSVAFVLRAKSGVMFTVQRLVDFREPITHTPLDNSGT